MAPGLLRPLGAPATPTSPRGPARCTESARASHSPGPPRPRLTWVPGHPEPSRPPPARTGAGRSPTPNFPPRALGACPAPGLEVHSPAAAKGQGREESGEEAGGRSPRQPPAAGNLEGALESARAAAVASGLTPLGGSWERGRGKPAGPSAQGVGGDPDSQLPALALAQPPGCTVLAPGLRPEGGARAGASRPVSARLSTEVSWWPEPQTGCSHSVPHGHQSQRSPPQLAMTAEDSPAPSLAKRQILLWLLNLLDYSQNCPMVLLFLRVLLDIRNRKCTFIWKDPSLNSDLQGWGRCAEEHLGVLILFSFSLKRCLKRIILLSQPPYLDIVLVKEDYCEIFCHLCRNSVWILGV